MISGKIDHLKEKGLTEGKKLFWIFLYLWILLGLFAVHKSLVLAEEDAVFHQGFAIINAFVLAKVMFVAEAVHLADGLKHKPLIYPIAYKSAVFAVILIAFHLLEVALKDLWHGHSTSELVGRLRTGAPQLLVFGLIMFIVLMPFFALREIARDVGDDRLFEQFFRRRSRYAPLDP